MLASSRAGAQVMTESHAARAPLEKALPRFCYTSAEFHEREKECIFFREWICAGRAEELPDPGQGLVIDVAGESVLVVRARSGELRAHYNLCRHRGARLCSPDSATIDRGARVVSGVTQAGTIRCPYHAWTYAMDGRLLSAPHLGQTEGFRPDDFTLHPVGIDTWGGFFFLNLTRGEAAEAGNSLAAQLGAIPERLTRYPLGELRRARRIRYDVDANWKVIAENYNECYHCAGVHPELCEVVPAFKREGGSDLPWEEGIPHREGAFTFTRSGTTSRGPFPGLSESEKVRHKGELVYPNLFLSLSADHVAAFLLWPEGPGRTRIYCDFLFHPEEMAKPTFDPTDAVEFWDLINRQDWDICAGVQRGMSSRAHEVGYYAPMEEMSLDIRRYVLERVGELGVVIEQGGAAPRPPEPPARSRE